jgi:hypothetical protein
MGKKGEKESQALPYQDQAYNHNSQYDCDWVEAQWIADSTLC